MRPKNDLKESQNLSRELVFHHSPCPNDRFLIYGLQTGAVQSSDLAAAGISLRFSCAGIHELNRRFLQGQAQLAKVSLPVAAQSCGQGSRILPVGAAFSQGPGPLLLTKAGCSLRQHRFCDLASADSSQPELTTKAFFQTQNNFERLPQIFLPGPHTTAAALWNHFWPGYGQSHFCSFHEILNRLQHSYRADVAGIIIDEDRNPARIAQAGLQIHQDLGLLWQQQHDSMLPLGCLIAQAGLQDDLVTAFIQALRASLTWGWKNFDLVVGALALESRTRSVAEVTDHIQATVRRQTFELDEQAYEAMLRYFELVHSPARTLNSSAMIKNDSSHLKNRNRDPASWFFGVPPVRSARSAQSVAIAPKASL